MWLGLSTQVAAVQGTTDGMNQKLTQLASLEIARANHATSKAEADSLNAEALRKGMLETLQAQIETLQVQKDTKEEITNVRRQMTEFMTETTEFIAQQATMAELTKLRRELHDLRRAVLGLKDDISTMTFRVSRD